MWKHLCWSHFLTTLQISRPETFKRDSGTGIFLWIFRSSSKNFIYRTPLDDCCWFLRSNFIFFLLLIIAISYGSLHKKCLRMKIVVLFTMVFYFFHKCCKDNFASATISRRTSKEMQISFSKSLGNSRVPRRIWKAVKAD